MYCLLLVFFRVWCGLIARHLLYITEVACDFNLVPRVFSPKPGKRPWERGSRDFCISILPLFHSLLYRFPIFVLFDRGHPWLGNFNSTFLINAIRVKSCVNSFLAIDTTCVPVRISINKLDLHPNWIVAGLLATGESYVSVAFYDPFLNRCSCFPDVHFAALVESFVDYVILFSWANGILRSH